MQENKKFIIDVAPIARLPLGKQQFFSYLHDQELQPGTLASVPLFRRELPGVVLRSRPDFEHFGGFELKKVYKVLQEDFLTEKQLLLAEHLSQHYLSSLGVVLKHFMPKRVIARNSSHQVIKSLSHPKTEITLTPEQQSAVSAIADNYLKLEIRNLKFLLYGPPSSGKTEVYIHSILKLKQADPNFQFLILLPELTLAPQAIARYAAYFPASEIVLLHSKLPKGEFYQNWKKIQSGEAKIIIATRIGIFAPFKHLGLVAVDEEQDMSYKQWDMNPRYDARKGAEFLSDIFSCPLIFGTSTPRIESFHKTQTREYELLELPHLALSSVVSGKSSVELIDMRKEKWTDFAGKKKPNYSLLSLKLQSELKWILDNKMQSMLFINHQGMSSFSVCASCKAVLKCPRCERALVYDESGSYKCIHCNYSTDIIPTCKSCGAVEFKNVGMGTQAVLKEVKKFLPTARLARLDTQAIKKPGTQEEVYEKFSRREIDIIIGTQMITKGWDNPNVGLVAVIDADSLFSFPDYLTDERAFANIMQIAGRTGRFGSRYPGQVLIQTYNPNNPIFEFVSNRDYKAFFEKDVKQREALKYPPFGKLIKLTFKDESKEKTEKETSNVYQKISALISEHENIRVSEPSDPLVSKIRGKFLKQMIIKTGIENQLSVELMKLLGSLSSSWSIDVDPISIA